MSNRKTEHELQRFVATLARASDADIEGVLARLDTDERLAILPLLEQKGRAPLAQARGEGRLANVSPWLIDRIHADSSAAYAITPMAQQTLRAVALERPAPTPGHTRERWSIFRRHGHES